MDRVSHFAIAAAKLAWTDAGEPSADPPGPGCVLDRHRRPGEPAQAAPVFLEKGPDRVSPFMVPMLMPNASAGLVAMSSASPARTRASPRRAPPAPTPSVRPIRYIREGMADVCIAGGTEASVLPLTISGFAQMTGAHAEPRIRSTPAGRSTRERDGFVLSEGAGALVLEDAERAVARGARIYAEIAGYGASADAYHITAPEPEGARRHPGHARWRWRTAGEPPDEVDYINAHGTSTPANDAPRPAPSRRRSATTRTACRLLDQVDDRAPARRGRCGRGRIAALAIHDGVIPPTINYDAPRPGVRPGLRAQ